MQVGQLFGGVLHRFPIGLAAHDDANQRLCIRFCHDECSLNLGTQSSNSKSFLHALIANVDRILYVCRIAS
jgi:hypothetical protein